MKLQGEKCVLLPLGNEYAEEFSRFISLGLNFQYTFTGSIPMRPIDLVKEWDAERARGSLQWGIFDSVGLFVGTTGLHSHRDIYRSWEFRILIGHPDAVGKGIGSEATKLVVNWAFQRLNAHRVWLGVNEENKGAVRCYEKAGFKLEGTLREEIFIGGKYVNAIRMGILEKEWTSPSLVKAQ